MAEDYNVHLIEPVDAGPVMTLNELERERWLKQQEQILVQPIETQHAADQLAQVIADAEKTLSAMQTYVQSRRYQRIRDRK